MIIIVANVKTLSLLNLPSSPMRCETEKETSCAYFRARTQHRKREREKKKWETRVFFLAFL